MKTMAIYYFSGTGNTEIVAEMLKEEFTRLDNKVELIRMEDILKDNRVPETDQYDLIGIGNPVYGCGSPNIVRDFIKRMPTGNGKKVFIFKTGGGVVPMNYNASKKAIRQLSKKGYQVIYDRLFSIGSNWLVKFDDRVMKQLYQATKHKVKIMCNEISTGKKRVLKPNLSTAVVSGIVFFLYIKLIRFLGKDYRVTSACTHCGKCIVNCPTANIYEKRGRIKFKLSCLWCMRCLYGCPKNAIQPRLLFFCVVPGGYNIRKVIDADISESCTGRIPPFFQNYIQNDEL